MKAHPHVTLLGVFLVVATMGCFQSDERPKGDVPPMNTETVNSNQELTENKSTFKSTSESSSESPLLGIMEWWPDNNPKVILQMRGDSVLERIEYYASGQVQSRGQLLEDARHGIWNSYYSSGLPWSQVGYQRGAKHGVYRTYHENGEPAIEGQYIDNNQAGAWLFFDDSGKLIREEKFSRD